MDGRICRLSRFMMIDFLIKSTKIVEIMTYLLFFFFKIK